MNVTMNERVLTRMPMSELSRRWALVQARLKERNLDALVILGSDDFLGGYVRWLIDRPAYNAYHLAIICYPDDLMTIIEHGPLGGSRTGDGSDPDYPGVGEVLQTSAFRSIHYLHGAEGELVSSALRRRDCRRIGMAGMGGMPHRFVSIIADIPGIEISDMTDDLDRMKAIKSAAEIFEIRKTAAMQDEIFRHVLENARPGMRDCDIVAIAQAEGRRLGSEGGVFFCGSAPRGEPAPFRLNHWQMRTINPGDPVTLLIENNGPGGYYTELGRTIVFGKAPSKLLDAFEIARQAQLATLARMTPGAACAEIADAHDRFLEGHGLAPERRLYAHSQGYDVVESPLVRADEPGHVEAGMNMAVHPHFIDRHACGYICDNYVIDADGPGTCLHATEKKVFELG
ncbi:M24 family metallopeptidase [Sphingobium sp.]|uniref:M24 family metallopeptidase n=1 Tax=Sphingobium sp. TaxID=1912891 RepID=UPI0028BD8E21|nr:M24 family metallopeptidase [Sphingobium sp.]